MTLSFDMTSIVKPRQHNYGDIRLLTFPVPLKEIKSRASHAFTRVLPKSNFKFCAYLQILATRTDTSIIIVITSLITNRD